MDSEAGHVENETVAVKNRSSKFIFNDPLLVSLSRLWVVVFSDQVNVRLVTLDYLFLVRIGTAICNPGVLLDRPADVRTHKLEL